MGASASHELAARLAYRQRVIAADEKLRSIVRTYWTRSEAQGQNTLWGLRGQEIRAARQQLEYLLKREEKQSGLNSPAIYGAAIKERAEAARGSLQQAPPTPLRRAQVPKVIEELTEIIDSLAEGEKEIEEAQALDSQ